MPRLNPPKVSDGVHESSLLGRLGEPAELADGLALVRYAGRKLELRCAVSEDALTTARAALGGDYELVFNGIETERFAKATANALTPEQAARLPWIVKLFNTRLFKVLNRSMIALDPPDHTRLRALVGKAFTPRLVEQMRERIQAITEGG